MALLNSEQFSVCQKDPTKTIERKIQKALRNVKQHLTEAEYRKIYPSGSAPAKLYGTAKVHKLKIDIVDDLPLRPIISNVGTASYQLAKYLVKLLEPLNKSEFTVSSTKEFLDCFDTKDVPQHYKLISFDVTSLFTNVPLDYTIDVVLRRIYVQQEIQTNIPRDQMKHLLILCTKNVHFTYNNNTYIQNDGVAMGSPLGPVLAGIFMVDLERNILPTLSDVMTSWKRYVDDTIS